jgi:hypothetical protein
VIVENKMYKTAINNLLPFIIPVLNIRIARLTMLQKIPKYYGTGHSLFTENPALN